MMQCSGWTSNPTCAADLVKGAVPLSAWDPRNGGTRLVVYPRMHHLNTDAAESGSTRQYLHG